jgi:hypothetical protein
MTRGLICCYRVEDIGGYARDRWKEIHVQSEAPSSRLPLVTCEHRPSKDPLSPILVRPGSRSVSLPFDNALENENSLAKLMIDDLQLLHNWSSKTYKTVRHGSDRKELWLEAIPTVALEHHFLMRGILAFSALHLAYMHPNKREKYTMLATAHQAIAIAGFRQNLARQSESNSLAISAFSSLLCFYSFATLGSNVPSGTDLKSAIMELLVLARGVFLVAKDYLEFFSLSPLSRIITIDVESFATPGITGNEDVDNHLASLYHLVHGKGHAIDGSNANLPLLAWTFKAQNDESLSPSDAYDIAIRHLSRCFYTAYRRPGQMCEISNVLIWPSMLPQVFMHLLAEQQPEALIILAHYCVLLNRLEKYWWIEGCAQHFLQFIDESLADEWKHWLSWAIVMVGYTPQTSSLQEQIPLQEGYGVIQLRRSMISPVIENKK